MLHCFGDYIKRISNVNYVCVYYNELYQHEDNEILRQMQYEEQSSATVWASWPNLFNTAQIMKMMGVGRGKMARTQTRFTKIQYIYFTTTMMYNLATILPSVTNSEVSVSCVAARQSDWNVSHAQALSIYLFFFLFFSR